MGGAFLTHGIDKYIQYFSLKLEGNSPLERYRCRCKDNTKTD